MFAGVFNSIATLSLFIIAILDMLRFVVPSVVIVELISNALL